MAKGWFVGRLLSAFFGAHGRFSFSNKKATAPGGLMSLDFGFDFANG